MGTIKASERKVVEKIEDKAKQYALEVYPVSDPKYDSRLPESTHRLAVEQAYLEGYKKGLKEEQERANNGDSV